MTASRDSGDRASVEGSRGWTAVLGALVVASLPASALGCGGKVADLQGSASGANGANEANQQGAGSSDTGGGQASSGATGSANATGMLANGGGPVADASLPTGVSGIGASSPGMSGTSGSASFCAGSGPCAVDAAAPGPRLACVGSECNALGATGSEFAVVDAWEGGMSTATLVPNTACIAGETGAWSNLTWGAMLAFNLGPAVVSTGSDTPGLPSAIAAPVQLGGSGIDVQLTFGSGGAPTYQQLMLVVFVADADASASSWYGDEYCVELPDVAGAVHVPWSAFTYQCWMPGNPALDGPPLTGVVGVQVSSVFQSTVADPYKMCVDELSIAP